MAKQPDYVSKETIRAKHHKWVSIIRFAEGSPATLAR